MLLLVVVSFSTCSLFVFARVSRRFNAGELIRDQSSEVELNLIPRFPSPTGPHTPTDTRWHSPTYPSNYQLLYYLFIDIDRHSS